MKGKLFFATALRFHTHFTPEADPAKVEPLFENPLMDYSAADALARVKGLYEAQEKELDVKDVDNPADGAPEAKPRRRPSRWSSRRASRMAATERRAARRRALSVRERGSRGPPDECRFTCLLRPA